MDVKKVAEELHRLLSDIGLARGAVEMAFDPRDGGAGRIYTRYPFLASLEPDFVKAIKRCTKDWPFLKELDVLRPCTGGPDDAMTLVKSVPIFDLKLVPTVPRDVFCTTLKSLHDSLCRSAAEASPVYKHGPQIPFRVLKDSAVPGAQPWQQIVTGVVLEPEVMDGTSTPQTEGDIYSEEEIYKGMVWWMEHGHPFSYHHIEHGGRPLGPEDVSLVENWQTRVDQTIGNQKVVKGTWVASAKINHPELWKDILEDRIQSWSVGMRAMGEVVQTLDPDLPEDRQGSRPS